MLLPSQLKEAHVQTHFGPLHPIEVFESTSSGKVITYLMTIFHNFFTISHTTIPHYKFTKRHEKFPKIPEFFKEIK